MRRTHAIDEEWTTSVGMTSLFVTAAVTICVSSCLLPIRRLSFHQVEGIIRLLEGRQQFRHVLTATGFHRDVDGGFAQTHPIMRAIV